MISHRIRKDHSIRWTSTRLPKLSWKHPMHFLIQDPLSILLSRHLGCGSAEWMSFWDVTERPTILIHIDEINKHFDEFEVLWVPMPKLRYFCLGLGRKIQPSADCVQTRP